MNRLLQKSVLPFVLIFLIAQFGFVSLAFAKSKVLVVMSYEDSYPGEIEMRAGIEQVLTDSELKYFYLDTKTYPENGPQKAQSAYELFLEFKPDAIIAADDNAQSLFVLPYIKGKTEIPVVFCGVNDDATKYGFPTEQITGVLEKKHYKQSIQFARLIDQQISKIAVLYKMSPSNETNIAQIEKERSGYDIEITDMLPVASTAELYSALALLEEKVDALLVLNLAGIDDAKGQKLGQAEAFKEVVDHWKKPTIGASSNEIKAGLLCAVAKRNIEQGTEAAAMVKQILSGTPVSLLPVSANKNGQRIINVTTAQKLSLRLKPMVLIGTELLQ